MTEATPENHYRKLICCDIDGTIFKHEKTVSGIIENKNTAELLPGVKEKFDEWASNGNIIMIISGRRECLREITERQLINAGLSFDYLILGVGNTVRYLLNDDKPGHPGLETAVGITLKRDEGFVNLPI